MSVLLAGNCNLRSLSVAHIGPHVDGRATITSPLSEKVLRSTSTTPNVSYGDIDKRTGSNASCSQAVKGRMSAASASANTGTSPGNKMVITKSDTLLKRIKRSYKFLHLNRLFSLGFMLIYMFIGALLFLWLEGASDRARKLHEYKFYINEKEMFLRRLDKIYNVKASEHRRVLLKNAIDYLHQQIGVSFSNRSDWSLTTALYYSGTVLTTIGYGDVACSTSSGRLMTVIYAILGIPLMLITLRDLGNFLYTAVINIVRLMHFTSRICSIFGRTVYKTSIQQSNIDLGQVENGILIGAGKNNIENRNENYDNHSGKPKFEIGDEVIEDSIKDEEAMLNYDSTMLTNNTPPRIPVFLAIGITFSWIFLCAGLFKIWERDWTYAESCYFMFISLSTIGLGDLSVRRRDLMIMCFVFVIIGLAMVSMCINVIQRALEDFCVKVFLKLFLEYQSKLNQGNGAAGASVGMMQMWDNNKKAKYLMQFLSKNKRTSVLAKAQKDAEAHGIEIPPLFSDIDEESGMPKLLTKDADESMLTVALEEIHQVEEAKQNTPAISQIELSLPKTVFYDVDVQTCLLAFDDKAEQTTTVAVLDTAIVTDPLTNEMVEKATQCHELALVHSIAQTESVEMKDSECVTIIPEYITRNVQTEGVQVIEQEIQTHLFDVLEAVTQTEAFIYSAHCIQTSLAETTENEMQTDPVIHEELKGRSRISKVRKRLQEAFGQRRESTCRSVTGEDEFSEGDEENESSEDTSNLDWDPIDGMHAEKQRRVRDLKEFFETSRKRGSVRRRSQFRSSAPPSQADAINFKINN